MNKGLSAEMLLCRTVPLPRKSAKTAGCKILPHYSFPLAPASASIAMPLPKLEATIVLPDFARSCSADGKHHMCNHLKLNSEQKRVKARQKSGPGEWRE
ncbi:MAG: hypothetical protein ACXVA2_23895 [Mucilaginibacter sp.]